MNGDKKMSDRSRDLTNNQRCNDARSGSQIGFGFHAEFGSINGVTQSGAAFFNEAYSYGNGGPGHHRNDRIPHRPPTRCPDNRFDPPLNMTRPPEPMSFGLPNMQLDVRHRPFGLPDVSINIGGDPFAPGAMPRPYEYQQKWQNVPRPYERPQYPQQPYGAPQRPFEPYTTQYPQQPYEQPQGPYAQVPPGYERPPQQQPYPWQGPSDRPPQQPYQPQGQQPYERPYQPQQQQQPYEQPQPKPKPQPKPRPAQGGDAPPKPQPKPAPAEKPEQPVVTKNADGSETGTYKDGSTLTKFQDGTAVFKRPDGVVMQKDPDGTLTTKYPDGRMVIKSPSGATTEVGPLVINPPNASDKGTGDPTSGGPPMKEDGDEKVVVTKKPDGTVVYTGEKSIVEVGPITVNGKPVDAPAEDATKGKAVADNSKPADKPAEDKPKDPGPPVAPPGSEQSS